jgi:hypothetical protein
MLLLVGVSVGVLSPPCGMETPQRHNYPPGGGFVLSPPCGMETQKLQKSFNLLRKRSKPTVWDGDVNGYHPSTSTL